MADCLFCRIVAGEIPATIVKRSEDAVALRDVDPRAPTHVLVIPTKHVPAVVGESPLTMVIGPEGGLTADELERLRGAGYTAVSLGSHTLRFETAAIAAAAAAVAGRLRRTDG